MTKVFLVLWLLHDGQSNEPPDRYEMPSIEQCISIVSEKLNSIMEVTDDMGTQYMAACIVEKARPA